MRRESLEMKILDVLLIIHGLEYALLPEQTRTAVDELLASPRGRACPTTARDVKNMLIHLTTTSTSVLGEPWRQLSATGPAMGVFHYFLDVVLQKRRSWPGYDKALEIVTSSGVQPTDLVLVHLAGRQESENIAVNSSATAFHTWILPSFDSTSLEAAKDIPLCGTSCFGLTSSECRVEQWVDEQEAAQTKT